MPYRLCVTEPAKTDIWRNYRWWSDHRSAAQADRWFRGVDELVLSLRTTADRHALATETPLRHAGVRQALFGVSRRPTHRILYAIESDTVIVYRVRSLKQDRLSADELGE